ncbi:hypothetical protein GCM10023201_40870 [Actinomycetospora corticicola]|uniref:DUF5047 domain-containing protein n=1 Tax=Actinomycetospora corticicola TaxID=663602 RepID=A0A7Y9DWL5_9PSEU|nr:DUF5047 domain-containing protein [Actinomycetospora corticicola]NYD36829.1 hypothetical protein [Actinomycetospora corticicola]
MGTRDYDAPIGPDGRVQLSARAQALIQDSSGAAARAWLLSSDGSSRSPLPLIRGGSVSADAKSMVRRTATLSVHGVWPDDPTSQLAPYGPRVQVQRGVRVATDAIEWVTLMTGPIWSSKQDRSKAGAGPLAIPLKDEMAVIEADGFDAATSTNPAEKVITAVTRLIQETLPLAQVVDLSGNLGQALCAKIDLQQARAGGITKLAASVGCEVYAGREFQTFYFAPVPTLDDSTRWLLAYGGVITTSSRERTRDDTYNRVLVKGTAQGTASGEAQKPAPYAEAILTSDMDPHAYYGGPLGRRTWKIERAEYDTAAKCAAAAPMWLERARGRNVSQSASTLVNPAADPGDVVDLRPTKSSPRCARIVDSLTYPLGAADAQNWTTRGDELPDSTEGAA